MNHVVVAAGAILTLAGNRPTHEPVTRADLPSVVAKDPIEPPSAIFPFETVVTADVPMPGPQFDQYPAVQLPHESAEAPGVILNALNGEIIRQGVTLWSGGTTAQPPTDQQSPVQPNPNLPPIDHELVRQYFDKLVQRKSQVPIRAEFQGFSASPGDMPVSVIRNSVCNAHGEIYGRVLESVPVITTVERP